LHIQGHATSHPATSHCGNKDMATCSSTTNELDGPSGGGSGEAAIGGAAIWMPKPSYPGTVMRECELGVRKL
jgi:hypothetical protein